jgi:hypothetical protein
MTPSSKADMPSRTYMFIVSTKTISEIPTYTTDMLKTMRRDSLLSSGREANRLLSAVPRTYQTINDPNMISTI